MTPQGQTCGCRDVFMLDTDLKSCKQDLSWKAPRYKEDDISAEMILVLQKGPTEGS